jgi:hypothetical protein
MPEQLQEGLWQAWHLTEFYGNPQMQEFMPGWKGGFWCELSCTDEVDDFVGGGRPSERPCQNRNFLQQLLEVPWKPCYLSTILLHLTNATNLAGVDRRLWCD